LEQVFLTRRAGRIELLTVRVDAVERRTRSTLLAPTADLSDAIRWLARHLVREGEVANLERLRVRVQRGGAWQDAPELRGELRRTFAADRRDEARR
jgi:hypothetical protein